MDDLVGEVLKKLDAGLLGLKLRVVCGGELVLEAEAMRAGYAVKAAEAVLRSTLRDEPAFVNVLAPTPGALHALLRRCFHLFHFAEVRLLHPDDTDTRGRLILSNAVGGQSSQARAQILDDAVQLLLLCRAPEVVAHAH